MEKTPIRKQIVDRLIAMNDQLCFFLLIENEFHRRIADFGPGVHDAFTRDVFARSSYAPKINVRIGKLSAFQSANRSFTFGAYFSTSYEIASDFFEVAKELLRRTNSINLNLKSLLNKGLEENYAHALTGFGLVPPPSEVILTMAYCRHRRNAFIHMHPIASNPYAALAAGSGLALNNYWNATRLPVDFRQATVGPLVERETIGLIKLLRIAVEVLDEHLASVLSQTGVLALLAAECFSADPVRMNSIVAAQRCRVLAGRFRSDYGGDVANAALDHIVRSVGIR